MATIRVFNMQRLQTFRKAFQHFYHIPTRHVVLGWASNKYSKETVSAIIQMKKENLALYGKLVKPSKENDPLEEESDGSIKTDPPKKRGRPKKVKTEELNKIESSETAQPKKRGKGKKTKANDVGAAEVKGSVKVKTKTSKQGNNKKKPVVEEEGLNKLEAEFEKNHTQNEEETTPAIDLKKSNTGEVTASEKPLTIGYDPDGSTTKLQYASDPDEQSITNTILKDLSPLPVLLSFPFFHPSKREYFLTTPEAPDIYIPGYTERASALNPFFPSVGTILGATQPPESRMMLKKWRDNLVKELGEEGFQKYQKELFARGVNFHEVIEHHLKGDAEVELLEQNSGFWHSAQSVLKDITDVQAVEEVILHKHLCYKGQFDCIASYRDRRVLIDWKTSKKPRASIQATYDNPLQVAAYIGAYNYIPTNNMVDNAMIVVCYEDGQPAQVHRMTRSLCIDYWGQWLHRLHAYWLDKLSAKARRTR